jgi:hypothetical protein
MAIRFFLIIFSVIASGCTVQQQIQPTPNYGEYVRYENNAKGKDKLMHLDTVKGFEEYSSYRDNKAFAQSLSGAWGWTSEATSIEHAKTGALANCQVNNTGAEFLYPCEVINLNGEWIEK